MPIEPDHVSDEELLLTADGELPDRRAAAVREHLASCWGCRTRSAELQSAIREFIHFHREQFGTAMPPPDGPRALLRARLRERDSNVGGASLSGIAGRYTTPRFLAIAFAFAVTALLIVSLGFLSSGQLTRSKDDFVSSGAMPEAKLTPGEIIPVTTVEVCSPSFPTEQQIVLPASLRFDVFQRYGMRKDDPNAFEVDYLITPDLGGASTVRNLWPQPYDHTLWNARVKDELEVHLKNLVCNGNVKLSKAQHDLAGDWITAYKHYFQTAVPLGKPHPFSILLSRAGDASEPCDIAVNRYR